MDSQAPSASDRIGVGRKRPTTRDGLVAGLLGGVAVVLLFFVLDVIQGDLVRTPSFLASAVFGVEPEAVGAGHMAAFTFVHLAIFSVVGGGAVWLCRVANVPENVLLGGIYGLFVYTLLFYFALALADVPVLEAPGWPAVMTGNFVAGMVLGGYLRWVGPLPGVVGLVNLLEEHRVLREGMVAGLLGAGVLAAWFLVIDLLLREAFFTPAALGSMLFLGAAGPGEVVVSAGTVLGYTAVHIAGFLIFGVVVSGLVNGAEKYPALLFAIVMLFAIFGVAFVGMVTVLGFWILEELAIWAVLVGNLLAALGMGIYLWRAHPVLREEIRGGALWREP